MSRAALAAELTALAHALRGAGVPVDPARVTAAMGALVAINPVGIDEVYWPIRSMFCSRRAHLPVFDFVFAQWLGVAAPAPHAIYETGSLGSGRSMTTDPAGGQAPDPKGLATAAGWEETLRERAGRSVGPADLAEIDALIALLAPRLGVRRSPRLVVGRRRQLDLRRTAQLGLRGGGEFARLRYRQSGEKSRRIVLLIDVSASMTESVDALLRVAYAMVAVAPMTTEVFTLGTRLTRITLTLRDPDPLAALPAAESRVRDRDGGTRLGANMREYLQIWAGRSAIRSAITVIASDGWDADRSMLSEQMQRLSRLSHRLIWLDPSSRPGVRSFAPGLVVSRPWVNHFVAGRDFEALREFAESIAGR